ncbi:hypothetical protein NEOC84_001433|uniref:DUF2267 domain-containing protein n=1 Tax=Neochlamydia sp. AcF84 TaxID=2315858 RepID=UPI00140AD146|nr:DUF2267 domain-containing protein [Neochlamydia sp. AcF84]NGY95512.1 hypothetical protein [Neochlamydia sp. AcF84]
MSVDVFETTLQKTHEWLKDLMKLLGWTDEKKAYLALKGTLQALRDRLSVEVSAKLSAQLPMLVRGFYYEGWKPSIMPVKVKTTEEFLDFVAFHFNSLALVQYSDVEKIVRAVFQVVTQHVSKGEIEHIRQVLPLPIAALWPSSEG